MYCGFFLFFFLMLPLQGMVGSLHGIGFAWVKQAELAPPDLGLVQHCRCSWTKYCKGIQFIKAFILHSGCFVAFVYAYLPVRSRGVVGIPWLFIIPAVALILLILNLILNQRRLNRCSASSAAQYPLVVMNQTQYIPEPFPVVISETPNLDSFVKSPESSV